MSAGWIDADRLRRYSSIYAAQNASAAITIQEASNVLSGQRMIDILVDMKMDDYQPRELLHVVNQMAEAASEVAHGLDSLAIRIDSALSNVPESSTQRPLSS